MKIKKLNENAVIPTYGTEYSAGADLYACTDEFHQIFVPGREGAFRDVIIDTCGGITLILLYNLIRGLKNRYIRKEMQ